MYLALYEDITGMHLSSYLLLCANDVLFTVSGYVLHIHMWYTLVGYIHDADWLHYLHEWVY